MVVLVPGSIEGERQGCGHPSQYVFAVNVTDMYYNVILRLSTHGCHVSTLLIVLLVVLQGSGIDDCISGAPFEMLPVDRIRFLPSADISKRNGSASFQYRVWDGTDDPCQSLDTSMYACTY